MMTYQPCFRLQIPAAPINAAVFLTCCNALYLLKDLLENKPLNEQ